MKKGFLLSLLIVFSETLLASGTTIGNGGFVLSCGSEVQIFDHYEIMQKGFKIEKPAGENLDEKVENLLKKLEVIDPNRAKNYRFQYKNSWNQNLKKTNFEGLHLNAEQVQDLNLQKRFGLGKAAIPEHCELILALQQMSDTSEDRRSGIKIEVYMPVWNRLDLDTKAALVIHELFYRELLLSPFVEKNSMGVRFLSGYLSTFEFRKLLQTEWTKFLNSASFSKMFPNFQLEGVALLERNAYGCGPDVGYAIDLGDSAKLLGQVALKGNAQVEIETFGWSSCFYKGEIPDFFHLRKSTTIDMTLFAGAPLQLNIDPECDIEIDQKFNIVQIGKNVCKSYLEKYLHNEIKFSGPIVATYKLYRNVDKIEPLLSLLRTPFSILQNRSLKGDWVDVDSILVNVKTGQIISAGLCPGCILP